jgi:cell division protein FtsB
MEAFQTANLQETIAGRIVLSIGCNTKSDADLQALGQLTDEAKAKLDELHKRKIDLADEIYVLNVGGYIGNSTRSEIEYAEAHHKMVRYLVPLHFSLGVIKEARDEAAKDT